jgi:hypothetical protein
MGVHYLYEGNVMINWFIYVFCKLCWKYGMSLKSNNCEEVQWWFAKMVRLSDWCDLSKNIKFLCNTFILVLQNNLIIEFYRATKKKSNLIAIHLVSMAILFSIVI